MRLYRIPRRLSLGRIVADSAVAPNRGIAPGCAFAITLVKVYCYECFCQFVIGHPQVGLDVYIDDIQLAVEGQDPGEVVSALIEAADDMVEVIEEQIKARIAIDKTAVVSSSNHIAKRLRKALGENGGQAMYGAVALGVDYCAGKPVRRTIQKKRFGGAAACLQRIAQLHRRGGQAARKMVTAGRVPSAIYGAEVYGVDDDLALSLQRTAASCVPPNSRRRDIHVALALQHMDVVAEVTAPPLLRWAKEVWTATAPFAGPHFNVQQLRTLWEDFH